MSKESQKALYEKRKAAGMCVKGCGNKAVSGRIRCSECLTKRNAAAAACKARFIAAGMCVRGCGNKAVSGRIRCSECLTKRNAAVTAHQARLKAAGMCVRGCGNKAVSGRIRCSECLTKRNAAVTAHQARLKAAGMCVRGCGNKAVSGRIRCSECLTKRNAAAAACKARFIAAGMCVSCGKRPAYAGTRCALCRGKYTDFRRINRGKKTLQGLCECGNLRHNNLLHCNKCLARTSATAKKRQLLYKQEGKCVTCGAKLDPMLDFRLDNIYTLKTTCNVCSHKDRMCKLNKI